jgi:murein DD-endopeptidase MepM/ murein hydrolase activator NlpD
VKKILFFLLIALPVYIPVSLYFLDKNYFTCPILYRRDMVVRCDDRGDGFFAASRNGRRIHEGIDLFAEVGTPVLAARSGKVVSAKQNNGMGKFVIIRHMGEFTSIYGHLSEIHVNKGDFVRQGQIIGLVGKTGNANYRDIQPHLHFEIRKDGIPADPLEYLN